MSDASLAENEGKALRYPFDSLPEPGGLIEVAPGVHWLRMPLPFHLNHINLWLIEDGDGWVIVDTGVATDKVQGLWDRIFERHLGGKPVTKVIVTHLHPDHVGNAGWLTRKWDIELFMSRTDYLMCRNLVADTGRKPPQEATRFYRAAGFDEEMLETYMSRFGGFGTHVSALPDAFHRLQHNDRLAIGGRSWEIVVGSGHAPEHVCLYCAELKLVISGDQILPRISSNVSVFPTEPNANPLADWLSSCAALRERLPGDALILPAHNEPFYGVHERLTDLIEEHERGLGRLAEMCAEPKRSVDVFPALFKREIGPDLYFMATGESLAHLNCLLAREEITVERDADGVDWYQRRT